jgi:hypothetical protein
MEDTCTREMRYIKYTPVYMTSQELTDVRTMPAQALEKPGKIYFYNNYIFVNERNQGIHIIDNSNPSAPNNVAFVNIPGNRDMAVQGNFLYADNGDDLVTLDITDPMNVTEVSRQQDAFPEIYEYEQGWLVYYDEEEMSEIVDCNTSDIGRWNQGGVFIDVLASADAGANSSTVSSGVGGSMARFTISQGHLYAVDNWQMNVFDIATNPSAPNELNEVNVGWGIETIFPYQDKLFIGSNSGMFIFDNRIPSSPTQLSSFQHARACDPVYVKDNYAYVTLRSGTWCEGFSNQLDLIDITDLTNPKLEETFAMDNPHGLSIKDDNLYLCEGDFGLKTFDISNPKRLNRNKIDQIKDLHAYDVINVPNSDILLVIGEDGLYQYDVSNPSKLSLVSKIEVVK